METTNTEGAKLSGAGNNQELQVQQKQGSREPGTHEGPYFEPAVDIYETEEALTVQADLPGVDPESIETDVRENLLTITGRVSAPESRWRPSYSEYRVGHFVRQFRLGHEIDQAKISAQFKDGVLTLNLPKADHARPRRIKVVAG